jgi:hypothetical protein
MVERSEVIRLSTRASPELVGVGRNSEATTRATWLPERGEGEAERVRERGWAELVQFKLNQYVV